MQEPLVSVIIPTYNRQNLIVRAVQSVLKQTYENIELIVVDDGSTDNTKKVLANLDDSRLKVIETDGRMGANFARNLGVTNAQGSLIAFQDSDDVWQVDKLQIQVERLETLCVDAVFSSFIRLTQDSVRLKPFKNYVDDMNARQGVALLQDCLRSNVISTQVLLIRKNVFNDLHGFDNGLHRLQDWDLALRLLDKFNVNYIDQPLVTVYEQEDSISLNVDAIGARKQLIQKHIDMYKANNFIYLKVRYDLLKVHVRSLKNRFKEYCKEFAR